MWKLCFAALLATATMAQAQQLDVPKTIKLHNKGVYLGTATMSGNTIYIRNKDGEHIYTTVRNPDGTATTFDTRGNIIAPITLPGEEDAK